jgi:hypothetical protein
MTSQSSSKNNIAMAVLRSFGETATSKLQIKLPQSVFDKLQDHKIEIIDYEKIIPNTSTIYISKDNIDIISYTFRTLTPDAFKMAFKEISKKLNPEENKLEVHSGN